MFFSIAGHFGSASPIRACIIERTCSAVGIPWSFTLSPFRSRNHRWLRDGPGLAERLPQLLSHRLEQVVEDGDVDQGEERRDREAPDRNHRQRAEALWVPIFNYDRFLYFTGYAAQASKPGAL